MSRSLTLRRRRFLQLGGAGLAVGFVTGCALPVIPKRPRPDLKAAAGWVRFVDGRYTLYIPRAEMGQNIATALKQIACDELGIAWEQIDVRLPNTSQITRVRATVGSESVKDFALPLAQACAMLREAVASGRRQGELKPVVRPASALRSLSGTGTGTGTETGTGTGTDAIGNANASTRPYVGRAVPIEHGPAIVRGKALFAADVRRPGQLYGRVLRAPASPELPSTVAALDDAAARAVPGFVALVRDGLLAQGNSEGLGIVARTPGALDRIEAALAVRWDIVGSFEPSQIDEAIDIDRRLAADVRREHRLHDDRIDAAGARDGNWDIDLRIDIPLAAHAPIEPRAAVAAFSATGGLELWVGTQDVFYQRDVIARRLGLAEDEIVVHGQRVGGGFGGKTICTVELEAAVLARATQAPVKVQWSRAQEFRQGFHRPPSSHRIRARLDGGRLGPWWHSFASSHILFTNAVLPPWLQRITHFTGDDGVARGAALPYRAAARRTEFDLVRLPVLTGPWRGLGAAANGFAIESAIDECARRSGIDPLQWRLANAADRRLVRVLERAAGAAGWGPRPAMPSASFTTSTAATATAISPTNLPTTPPTTTPSAVAVQRGRGVACGIYKAMSYAAVVADVEVDVLTGRVKVTRLVCAHDCGRVINPDQVRAQCEGNLVWGLGMVLIERLPLARMQVAASTFADSPIPRMADVPPLQIVLVDAGDPPTGAGETAIVAAGAAIANAVRDAIGWRARRLPLEAEDVRRRPAPP